MVQTACPQLPTARANVIQSIFDDVCEKYNIDTPFDKSAFLAQICHESGEFSIKTENMNYTTPQRIVDIWPSRFGAGKLDPNEYAKNPQKLANEVYANRMGNGNQDSGDGYRYRGAGFLQLTGKESFKKYAGYIGKSIEDTAALVRSDDFWAMDSAAWEYVVDKKLLGVTDFELITKRINGGLIGFGERKKYLQRLIS